MKRKEILILVALVIACTLAARWVEGISVGSMKLTAPNPEIVSFGPNPVVHGTPFNQQANGQSAIWVKMKPAAPPGSVLLLNEKTLTTAMDGNLLTAAVDPDLFDKPGTLKLTVEMDRDGKTIRSKPVDFVVK